MAELDVVDRVRWRLERSDNRLYLSLEIFGEEPLTTLVHQFWPADIKMWVKRTGYNYDYFFGQWLKNCPDLGDFVLIQ